MHGLRYGMVVAGIGSWLWQGEREVEVLVISLLISLALLAELALYGPRPGQGKIAWAALQLAAALWAFAYEPGVSLALVVGAVVAGIGADQPWPRAAGACGLAMAVSLAVMQAGGGSGVGDRTGASAGAQEPLAVVALYVLTLAAGRLMAIRLEERRAHERTVAELKEAEARLARMAAAARELAAAEEHRRLAEELHDTLGHALVGTLLQVQLAGKLVQSNPEAASKRLELVEQNVRETLQEVRRALRRSRRGVEALPLHLALESLVAEFRALGGPEVTLTFRPDGESISDVSAEVREALFRTVQEALTNSVRHGKAQHVVVEAEASGPRLYLTIKDDGIGADSYAPGMGLLGMVGRIQAVGGTLRFYSQAGRGFQIHVGVRRR